MVTRIHLSSHVPLLLASDLRGPSSMACGGAKGASNTLQTNRPLLLSHPSQTTSFKVKNKLFPDRFLCFMPCVFDREAREDEQVVLHIHLLRILLSSRRDAESLCRGAGFKGTSVESLPASCLLAFCSVFASPALTPKYSRISSHFRLRPRCVYSSSLLSNHRA